VLQVANTGSVGVLVVSHAILFQSNSELIWANSG
jgi:hypothetical protein